MFRWRAFFAIGTFLLLVVGFDLSYRAGAFLLRTHSVRSASRALGRSISSAVGVNEYDQATVKRHSTEILNFTSVVTLQKPVFSPVFAALLAPREQIPSRVILTNCCRAPPAILA